MLRPPPPHDRSPHHADDTDPVDTGSFGGLADVLEPDPDAVTSMHRLDAASFQRMSIASRVALSQTGPHQAHQAHLAHLAHQARASVGPLSARGPLSVRAPVQVQDFAFADTVFAPELELAPDSQPPPSGPIFVNDPYGHSQCVTPLAFPLPPPAADVDAVTRMRVLAAHARHAFLRSREEMRELWAGTAEIVDVEADAHAPRPSPFSFFVRRAVALWSCFQWSRADLTRAAMIGGAVFVVAAAIGAVSIDFGDGSAAAAGSEVRFGRTLDQHTGHKSALHSKR